MKSIFYITVLLMTIATVGGGSRNTSVGTAVETKAIDGVSMQQTVTTPEPNPLPVVSSQEEHEVIPNSGMVSSNVKWVSNDPTVIGNDVVMSPTGSNMMIGWNLNSPRVSFHDDNSNVPRWKYLSNPNVYRNFVALSANA